MTIKIHISRDFSFAEFDTEFNPQTGEGLPTREELLRIFDRLPGKNDEKLPSGLRATEDNIRYEKRQEKKAAARREPPATANQRRVLERYGEWRDNMTQAEASQRLSELGF